jgi:diguanylate cyclase (GGDEF)-like protein/PAS domain S-box-containing protein
MSEDMDNKNIRNKSKKPITKPEAISFEQALQLVIDNLPFDVWMKDVDGKYLAVNKSFVDYAGVPYENIIGAKDHDLYPSDEAEVYLASDQAVLTGARRGYFESVVDGKWKEEYKDLSVDEHGNLVGTTGFSRDVTSRKQMERDLEASERSKAVLISNLPGVAFRCKNDDEWTMTFLSDGCYELTGYYPDELLNNNKISYNELISPKFRDVVYTQWVTDIAANKKSDDEYIILTKSGEEKWVWEQSVPVLGNDGKLSESEGFILDITANKKVLEALDESEDRFRTIFEKAPIGIGIFNTKTGFLYQVNPKFAEILGRTMEELTCLDWKSYSHPAEIQENLDKLAQLNKKLIPNFRMNKRYIKPDGSLVWVNMMIVPFKAEAISDMHLCMIEDITDKKQKEEEIIYLSYHDSLTGLYNRNFFEEEKRRFDASRRLPMSVIMGDINGLKLINDSFGHNAGDRLLSEIGKLLKETCRAEDVLARIGGDEFVIMLYNTGEAGAERLCQRIYKACKTYEKRPDKQTFYLSISLGFATKTTNDLSVDDLLREAEHMLYRVKNPERKKVRSTIMNAVKKQLAEKNFENQTQNNRIMKLVLELGERLGLEPEKIKLLRLLQETHDMGQLSLDEKYNGQDLTNLTLDEMKLYTMHAETGYRVAMAVPEMNEIAVEILAHHEHWDGSGYPKGLKGEEIPLLSRIICITDSYHQLSRNIENQDLDETKDIATLMLEGSGSKFDPLILREFLALIHQ